MSNQLEKVKAKPQTLALLLKSPVVVDRLKEVLGKRATQFAATLLIVSKNSTKLSRADPASVLSSAMIAATLDLSIDPNLGQAAIVPYNNAAQLQIGYKGFIQLAQRSGQFRSITDTVVPCGVLVSYNPLTEELELDWDAEKEGKPDGYVFYFKLLNGFTKQVYWPYDRAFKHGKRYSVAFKQDKDTPWKTNFDAMALKTVIKLTLNKYAPLSIEMSKAIEADQSADGEYVDNQHEEPEPSFRDKAGAAKPVGEAGSYAESGPMPNHTRASAGSVGSVGREDW